MYTVTYIFNMIFIGGSEACRTLENDESPPPSPTVTIMYQASDSNIFIMQMQQDDSFNPD